MDTVSDRIGYIHVCLHPLLQVMFALIKFWLIGILAEFDMIVMIIKLFISCFWYSKILILF